MIKTMLDISDMCHKCPWFEAEMEANKLYAGSMYVHIKSFIAGNENRDNGM